MSPPTGGCTTAPRHTRPRSTAIRFTSLESGTNFSKLILGSSRSPYISSATDLVSLSTLAINRSCALVKATRCWLTLPAKKIKTQDSIKRIERRIVCTTPQEWNDFTSNTIKTMSDTSTTAQINMPKISMRVSLGSEWSRSSKESSKWVHKLRDERRS